jgi:hypothetical protein
MLQQGVHDITLQKVHDRQTVIRRYCHAGKTIWRTCSKTRRHSTSGRCGRRARAELAERQGYCAIVQRMVSG